MSRNSDGATKNTYQVLIKRQVGVAVVTSWETHGCIHFLTRKQANTVLGILLTLRFEGLYLPVSVPSAGRPRLILPYMCTSEIWDIKQRSRCNLETKTIALYTQLSPCLLRTPYPCNVCTSTLCFMKITAPSMMISGYTKCDVTGCPAYKLAEMGRKRDIPDGYRGLV